MFNPRGFGYDDDDMFGGPAGFGRRPLSEFKEVYRCFSIAMLPGNDKKSANYGGKVFMPPSALAKLSSLHIEYPMIFEIKNNSLPNKTHAGVLEFIAEEGRVYIPNWMMQTLLLQEGQLVQMRSTSLPLGKFVKIQPQSVAFLDITDPKAVLEQAFRSFTTLTQGDIISINYNDKLYDILLMETKPDGNGISIIETDLEVDFAAPLGYVDPEPVRRGPVNKTATSIEAHTFKGSDPFCAFFGGGLRLNGKENSVSNESVTTATALKDQALAPAALRLPPGKLFFGYPVIPVKSKDSEDSKDGAKDKVKFTGAGQTLRAARASARTTAQNSKTSLETLDTGSSSRK
ncbi:ubiquitin fusion degradation protein [Batrachochytrium dendrobatidis]